MGRTLGYGIQGGLLVVALAAFAGVGVPAASIALSAAAGVPEPAPYNLDLAITLTAIFIPSGLFVYWRLFRPRRRGGR